MTRQQISALQPIKPDQIQMLQRVFDRVAENRGVSQQSDDAANLASVIIDYYQHGIAEEDQLLRLMQ